MKISEIIIPIIESIIPKKDIHWSIMIIFLLLVLAYYFALFEQVPFIVYLDSKLNFWMLLPLFVLSFFLQKPFDSWDKRSRRKKKKEQLRGYMESHSREEREVLSKIIKNGFRNLLIDECYSLALNNLQQQGFITYKGYNREDMFSFSPGEYFIGVEPLAKEVLEEMISETD